MKVAIRVIYILSMTMLGLWYFYQPSITLYWQQTYHIEPPYPNYQNYRILQLGPWLTAKIVQQTQYFELQVPEDERFKYKAETSTETVIEHSIVPNVANVTGTIKEHNEFISEDFLQRDATNSNENDNSLSIKVVNLDANKSYLIADVDNESKIDMVNDEQTNVVSEMPRPKNPQPLSIQLAHNEKVFFAGDSLMQGVAPHVKKALFSRYKIESIDLSKQSTGLAYPSVFNWPKVIEEKLADDEKIKLLIVFLGPNDPWNYPIKGHSGYLRFKSEIWETNYRWRIERILKAAQQHHVQVIWLGVPCMRDSKLNGSMYYLNGLYESEVEKANQLFLPTDALLGCDSEGHYYHFVKADKGNIKVRFDDGIHFTIAGQKRIANMLLDWISVKQLDETLDVE